MKELHDKQKAILKLLKDNLLNPLTMVELSAEAGIDSPGVLYHHLRQLEKKGYLKRNPDNPKDYVIMDSPEKAVVYINKYGTAQCGPDGGILDGTPIDRIPIATSLLKFSSADAFIVEAKGDSMEPKIKSGDIIIAKKQMNPDSGDLVVCVYQEKVLIKQYLKLENRVILNSFNKAFDLIEVRDNLRVEGIVKNIIHYG